MDTVGQRLITNGAMGIGPLVSEVYCLDNIEHVSVNCEWTGTPSGTLTYEISSDMSDPTSFQPLASVSPAGSADQQIWLDRNAPYKYLRITYIGIGGAGTLNVNIIGKGDL
jgi:hypothetical protein